MPRNTSGTYSATAGVPVTPSTTISTTMFNGLVSDLSVELTDSLSRSAKGPMLAQLRNVDGTVAAPAVTFSAEPSSGMWRAGANDVRLAVGGVDALKLTSGGIAGPLTFPSGSTAIQVTLANGFLLLQGNQAAGQVSTVANPADVVARPTAARTAGFIFQVQRNDGNGIAGCDYQGLWQLQNPAAIQPSSMVTAIGVTAGWSALNGLAYFKDVTGVVRFKGELFNSGGANPAFTLPAGYRPTAVRKIAASDGANHVTVVIDTAGVVSVVNAAGTAATGYLDGVAFLAEQ